MIIFDPGHGGTDPGAVGATGTREADINYIIANKCMDLAIGSGHRASITHGGYGIAPGTSPNKDLNKRAAWVVSQHPRATVSIHCNGHTDPRARGCEVFYYPGDAAGKRLAEIIYNHLLPALGVPARGIKHANFAMTREPSKAGIPAVLVELAFITNPHEELLLLINRVQDAVAAAIVRGCFEFMDINIPISNPSSQLSEWEKKAAAARQWVMDNHISDGSNPGGPVTREQVWVMLYQTFNK